MPSAPVTRSRTSDARQRREAAIAQVLDAVEELLSGGELYTELPVARIAQASGIPRSTFYQYFPNKSSLLVHVAGLATENFFAAPRGWFARPDPREGGVEGVATVIATMLAEYRRHWAVMRALDEVAAYDSEVGDFWFGLVNDHIDLMAASIQGWQAEGAVDAAVDAVGVTTAMVWMVERSIRQHVLRPVPGRVLTDAALVASLSRAIWLTFLE